MTLHRVCNLVQAAGAAMGSGARRVPPDHGPRARFVVLALPVNERAGGLACRGIAPPHLRSALDPSP